MNRTKLKQFPELSKPVMKTYFHSIFLTRSKLLIRYTGSDHKRHSFIYNPIEACQLMEDMGYIDDFIIHDEKPIILEETSWCYPHSQTGEPVEVTSYNEIEWKDYVKSFNKKSVKDRYWIGKALFNWIDLQQKAEAYRQKIYSIPTLVRHIA
jgi:hypothetical protein